MRHVSNSSATTFGALEFRAGREKLRSCETRQSWCSSNNAVGRREARKGEKVIWMFLEFRFRCNWNQDKVCCAGHLVEDVEVLDECADGHRMCPEHDCPCDVIDEEPNAAA